MPFHELPFAHAAAQQASQLSHSLYASLRQSAPVRSRVLEGSRMNDAVRSRQPFSVVHPCSLSFVVLKRLSSESHGRTVLRIVHTAGARPIEGDRIGQTGLVLLILPLKLGQSTNCHYCLQEWPPKRLGSG